MSLPVPEASPLDHPDPAVRCLLDTSGHVWEKRMRRAASRGVAVLAVLAVVAGCGDSRSEGATGDTHLKVAKIAVIAPLDAGLVQFGRGIRNSVQLAVDEANAGAGLGEGWRLEVLAVDDSSTPATGEAAARRVAADPDVIGVVGTYNSGVAARVAPVLEADGIVMVSPGNTDPALTRGPDLAHPVRPRPNYFRLVAADDVQGPLLARYAFDELKARRLSVVTEGKPVSKGMAVAFTAAFTAAGGTVVSSEVVPDGTTDFHAAVTRIVPVRPDLVLYGGEYHFGAPFTKQAEEAGITAPVMGSDGLKDDAYIATAGPASDGDYASSIGAPMAAVPSARRYLDAYARAAYPDPPSDFGVYSYDAANVVIAAARAALAGVAAVTPDVRRAITAAVQTTGLDGASGRLSFDTFGDPRTKVLTIYRVVQGRWEPAKTEELR